jgi:plasmid stabilization system protein ParE
MNVVLHADALRELHEAREWYTSRGAAEYALRLMRLVDARMQQIAERPDSFPRDPKRSWARRARILGSPYSLIFTVHEDRAIVLAMAHGKRRPAYWATRRPQSR